MNTVELDTPPGGRPSRRFAPSLRHCVAAVLSVFLAFVTRYFLDPLLDQDLPFTFFIVAALIVSWYGGALTGSLSLILGLLVGDYFFMGPKGALGISNREDLMQFIRSGLVATVGIFLIEILRRDRRRAELLALELEHEVVRRRESEAALLEAQVELGRHAADLEARVVERTAALSAKVSSLRDLLYHIAHHLRAPVRALGGYSTFLLEECGAQLDSTGRDYAARIVRAARRMDTLIGALLDFGRLDHMEVRLTDASLDAAIQKAVTKLDGEIKASNAEVKVVGPLPPVRADPEALAQVLDQLLANAIKFVPAGTQPRVQVWAEPHDSAIRLWVEDNGIGIEPKYHQLIFQAFERLHPSQAYEGVGIGLAIVQRATERMKGKVGVLSAPHGGSRFWVDFPRAAA